MSGRPGVDNRITEIRIPEKEMKFLLLQEVQDPPPPPVQYQFGTGSSLRTFKQPGSDADPSLMSASHVICGTVAPVSPNALIRSAYVSTVYNYILL